MMGTAGCQGAPSEAPQIPQGLSQLWDTLRQVYVHACVSMYDAVGSLHVDERGMVPKSLFQANERSRHKLANPLNIEKVII